MFRRLFCRHKWKTHAKEKYEWTEEIIVPGTEHWFTPKLQKYEVSETKEVLICDCGTVKIIKY